MIVWNVYSPTDLDFKLGHVECTTAKEALQLAKEKFGGVGHGVLRADLNHDDYAWVESKSTGLWVYKKVARKEGYVHRHTGKNRKALGPFRNRKADREGG